MEKATPWSRAPRDDRPDPNRRAAERSRVASTRLRDAYHRGDDPLELEAARSAIGASLFPSVAGLPASVGRYAVRRRIGAGGLGNVFAAWDPVLRRDVAIKLLHRGDDARELHRRLLAEAQHAAQLVHPAVVTIFDLGLDDGRPFIVMELIEGRPLSAWVPSRTTWRHGVAALARAARGLEAAHARGVIHRDFKPDNVLVGLDGRVCVADFGLARSTGASGLSSAALSATSTADTLRALARSGAVSGTPPYMAPEQYLGIAQDARTDQFAFCVSLYELIWQRRPFDGATVDEVRLSILRSDPPLPRPGQGGDVPDVLVEAVARGLSKNRQHRFATMGELAALLESIVGDVDLAAALATHPRSDLS